jgi:peptide/nickel transport system permease protein
MSGRPWPGIYRERGRRLLQFLTLRLLSGLLVLWVTTTVAFLALESMPADPAMAILGTGHPTPEAIREFRHEYGLDRPLIARYGIYIARLLQGDLGVSYSQHLPVRQILAAQIGPTLELTVSALILAWLLVLAWTLLMVDGHEWLSRVGSVVEIVSAGLPQFWLAILLLAVFAFDLHLFPPAGNEGWRALVLPSLALAVPLAGFIGQVTRESLEIVLEQPFILSARARGLGKWAIRYRHALRHAVIPGISLSGWAIGALISGAVVVEDIFSRQGLGRQLVLAVQVQDLPLALGVTVVVAICYVIASVLADLAYHWVDPRIRGDRQ